jgi:hypothetical protein
MSFTPLKVTNVRAQVWFVTSLVRCRAKLYDVDTTVYFLQLVLHDATAMIPFRPC